MTVDLSSGSDRVWLGQRVLNWTKIFFCFVYFKGRQRAVIQRLVSLIERYFKKLLPIFVGQKGTSHSKTAQLSEFRSNYSFWRPLRASVIISRFAYSNTLPAVIPRARRVISTGNSLRRLLM